MRTRELSLGLAAAAVAALLFNAVPVQAHHAFAAEFDANRPVKVKGTIVRVEWVNPHSWFHIDVKGPDGKVEEWMFEGGGPVALARRGFTKDYAGLKPGAEVVIEGYLSKGLKNRANARTMTFADGKALFVGSSGTGAPVDGKDATETRN